MATKKCINCGQFEPGTSYPCSSTGGHEWRDPLSRLDWQIKKSFQQNEDIQWLVQNLKNFHPFVGNVVEGIDPTFYQTHTYEGDKKLLDKFNEIRSRMTVC